MIPPPPASSAHASDDGTSILVETFAARGRHHSHGNRRHGSGSSRLQSFALVVSTLAAAVFCVLYIRKPVIVAAADSPVMAAHDAAAGSPEAPATPQEVPAPTPATLPVAGVRDGYEETNLRVQHVLNASTAEGDLSRIVIEVPVLYPSRTLRWTEAEIVIARSILSRVADYREQSRNLRELGAGILADWNQLIDQSIPSSELRADSLSLPANQEDASRMPRPTLLDSTDAIEIRPSGP